MEQLDDNLILSEDEFESLNLFGSDEEETQDNPPEKDDDKEKDTTEENEINPEDLFESPESVGSEDDEENKGKDTDSTKGEGSSPNSNFYYSIANALVEEGILVTLDKDSINNVNSPEDFAEIIEKEVHSRLDEKNKRISSALEADVEHSVIKQYEGVLNYLDSLNDSNITEESEKGEKLRQQLIYQDFINRGYSKERASREVKKSFDSGSDIEDAKEALASNKDYYAQQYDSLIKDAQKEVQEEKNRIKKEAEELKKSLLDDKEVFEGLTLEKTIRQKAYENIAKPVHKTEDGEYLTAIQKYELENPVDFRKKLSILFTMTDGFTNLDKLVKNKVKKEVKSSLRELENTLKGSNRPRGNLTFVGDTEENFSTGKGWQIDL